MSAVALAPSRLGRANGPGLDEVIVRLWEELAEDRVVACPACGGDMEPTYGAGARAVGGRCKHCDATLS